MARLVRCIEVKGGGKSTTPASSLSLVGATAALRGWTNLLSRRQQLMLFRLSCRWRPQLFRVDGEKQRECSTKQKKQATSNVRDLIVINAFRSVECDALF
mmetsp:Transcript_23863/g.43311  ORF Transcript_23863/g.43311 Transcript_23863/m.43311 type:complete len:100 (+) Transcript_23863:1748-2047(+)